MKRNLLIFGICLALVLGCLALLGGSKQPPAGDPGSSLELPENVPADTEVHTAGDGIKVIDPKEKKETPAPSIPVTPETVWQGEGTTASHSYTPPDKAALKEEDCIGILSIPAIDLEVKAIDPGTADMLSVMDKGVAHFPVSSAWDGNVALSAHNATADGSPAYFKDLHKLKTGDEVFYTTALGERRYEVAHIIKITDTDWDYILDRPDENRLTLVTCVSGEPSNRLMVQAKEVVG